MMLYMTVNVVRQGSCVNNFSIETAEINSEVKHLPFLTDLTHTFPQFSVLFSGVPFANVPV